MHRSCIAVIFHRLGPYHVARLAALSSTFQVTCIELSGKTAEYDWKKVATDTCFERITLFPEADSRLFPARVVAKELRLYFANHRFSAVAIPGWAEHTSLTALDCCLKTSTPAILMSESNEFDVPGRSRFKEFCKRQIVRLFSSALAGGNSHSEYLRNLGMSWERIFQGYDCVDNSFFAAGAQKAKADELSRESYGLPEEYFLACARFIAKKNLFTLIEAYARYRESFKNLTQNGRGDSPWKLVLLGSGPLHSDLVDLVQKLGLQTEVVFPGFKQCEELPVYYAFAKAFIHASTVEQWGLVVNEAMACGLPVLVSNRCGCAGDLVQPGVNGFTFDPYDVQELAALMVRLGAFPSESLAKMGAASRRIIDGWGTERFAHGMQAAVEVAVGAPTRPSRILRHLTLKMLLHATK